MQLRSNALRAAVVAALAITVSASLGDRLPDFKECVKTCTATNCVPGGPSISLQHRLLLWDCPSECDYTCQHVVTDTRLARDPPYRQPVLQFHGKWPFYRFLGMQEPFSVIFSLLNFLAHDHGMKVLREKVPASYPLRKFYLGFGYFGLASWLFSCVFHTRDFAITEKLDYFGAGASVMYGLFLSVVRVFRLDKDTPKRSSVLRAWILLCAVLYTAHVCYLSFWRFDYTYNMAANVAVGIVQNLIWSWFSISRYQKTKRMWAAWPGLIVAWVILAMSLELFDFPPWWGAIDAHSLWHLMTVFPTLWWYSFLIKDAQEDMQGHRLKA
ncbi:Per1-like protein [Aureobasidium pullulans]|uniref:Post-GPI attachment to proteins factor 3 n=1 Tax=Aureobasidium pullulans TaxID=5580 RepID=A0A4S9VZS2_AURPU|nr:Per1-like protein [Aureobasidium pullulans]THZ58050.1 Per1-like protein [Aureobasidium pullulans]